MVTVHRFKLFEQATNDWVVQLSKCTEDRIRSLGGQIIPGTAEEVERSMIDDQGRYIAATSTKA